MIVDGKPRAEVHMVSVCHDCRRKHEFVSTVDRWSTELTEWAQKHIGHTVEFISPKRVRPAGISDREAFAAELLGYRDNTNIKIAYAASAAFTMTLESLASSSSFLAGRQSANISNASNLYLDYMISGFVKVGTTPTANTSIRLYAVGARDDTPNYPDQFTGSNAARNVTNAEILGQLPLCWDQPVVSTSTGIVYEMQPRSLAVHFNNIVPVSFVLYLAHNNGAALDASAAGTFKATGYYLTA